MKNHTLMSLSIQREIKRQRPIIESEIDNSFTELNIKSLLRRSNIKKIKGFSTVSLFFVILLLPLSKINLTYLWTADFYSRFINAGNDTYYRFLNHSRFNWRKFIYLTVHPFDRLRASLEIALVPVLWERLKQILMMSSQLFSNESDTEMFFYFLDIIENTLLECNLNLTAKL